MDEHDHRADRKCTARLLEPVFLPVGRHDGLGHRTGRLLVLQRYAVGVAVELDRVLGAESASVGQSDLDLERVAAVDGRRAGDCGDEVGIDPLLETAQQQILADRRQARRRRGHDLDLGDGLEDRLDLAAAEA